MRYQQLCIGLLVAVSITTASCQSAQMEEFKRTMQETHAKITAFAEKSRKKAEPAANRATDVVRSAVEAAFQALGGIYEQKDGLMSDELGEPSEKKESYETLARNCPEAIEPISNAARRTGISPNYLLALAKQESGCDARAVAATSSAAGMFQFIDQTWLLSVHDHAWKYDERPMSDAILLMPSGSAVIDPDDEGDVEKRIWNKRLEPQFSAYMAAELARTNYDYLKHKLHREEFGATDLYMAHFLGPRGAYRFLSSLEKRPEESAAELFPQAAEANRHIFYKNGSGQARSLAEVHSLFKHTLESA